MALSDGVAWAEVPQSAGNTASAGLLSLVPFLLIFLIYYIFFMRRHSVPAILPLKAMFLNKVRGFSQRLDARGEVLATNFLLSLGTSRIRGSQPRNPAMHFMTLLRICVNVYR